MNPRTLLLFLLAGLGQLLAGCVVYMPMQCAAPQITDKKQAEITASTYLNGRVEIAGSYSPVKHLLVRASYSTLRDNTSDTVYYRGNQYDLGVGTYWGLGSKWLVGGLGGFGSAQSAAAYSKVFLFSRATRHEFDVRYNKLFGEAYAIYQANRVLSFGGAYRVTQINFTALTDQLMPLDLNSMTRSEPMFFVRARLGSGAVEDRPLQFQGAVGLSSTFGYNENISNNPYSPGVRELKQSRSYITLGITIFPHCLFRKDQPASGNQ